MWLKNSWRDLPVAVKLTALYALVLIGILAISAFLTLGATRHFLAEQVARDMDVSRDRVLQYLAEGNPLDEELLRRKLLQPGVSLRVLDEKKDVVLESDPYRPHGEKRLSAKDVEKTQREATKLHGREHEDEEPGEVRSAKWQGRYELLFSHAEASQEKFFRILGSSLLGTAVVGMLIAILAGLFLSRRILRPLRDMTAAAQEIEVHNLERRIPQSRSRDELHALALTFNRMLDRIQAGFEKQRRFTGDASHELRTPVTVISGYAAMLDRWGKEDPAVLDEGLQAIKDEAAAMQKLIEKLLFLARADQGEQQLKKQRIDLADVLAEVGKETQLIAPQHQVRFVAKQAVVVLADSLLLKQMLRIFMENSIKYTPEGGWISLETHCDEDCAVITVRDSGIGIAEQEQEKVFDRFYRVDKSRAKATGGTGLGLSIARWIVAEHGGSITLLSAPGEGTSVTVRLPLADAAQGKERDDS
ncbi:sensor histidine kinase [Azotosporobacter soli]|uniref:sensor histidine kinase n=1 Tax=Azotosporobacter soli TaxID=3055040 RepID=UPI0031FE75C0